VANLQNGEEEFSEWNQEVRGEREGGSIDKSKLRAGNRHGRVSLGLIDAADSVIYCSPVPNGR
jgi:hypothetical protein